jgi:hypothetical protein
MDSFLQGEWRPQFASTSGGKDHECRHIVRTAVVFYEIKSGTGNSVNVTEILIKSHYGWLFASLACTPT